MFIIYLQYFKYYRLLTFIFITNLQNKILYIYSVFIRCFNKSRRKIKAVEKNE